MLTMVTDLLVAGFPHQLKGDDPDAKGLLYKTAYERILAQFDGHWPVPVITFMDMDYVVTNDPQTMREFYASMNHTCDACQEGLDKAIEAAMSGDLIALVKINYTTEWTDHD